ncbi:hypothetical protein Ptr902_12552 [Pyrenophora tritici-repentis]|nr:hypothetical protein Alg215_04356 [Pyrenophora tritici-repentis]KAI1663608.1 hypothetical protein L13192_12297 [Pyrenophora tritici-repentis]KAI2476084.1 hypothetical protein Ptr902_12552 [Pyrenophora tritici-repentis]PWO21157.1 NADPH oxidase regulator NoxR [Pyrenophora tritici-repentis]
MKIPKLLNAPQDAAPTPYYSLKATNSISTSYSVVELAAAQQAQIKAIEELRKAPTEEKMLL